MANKSSSPIRYKGYSSPQYTPVPDELFDEQLPDLSGAELKVLLYVIRRTFGFKKQSDNISLNQMLHGISSKEGEVLDRGTGLSKKTLLEAIKSLVEKNLIITERRRSVERGDEPTTYRLNIIDTLISKPGEEDDVPRDVKTTPGGVVKTTPGAWSKNSPTQETVLQQTDLQYRNRSKSKALDNVLRSEEKSREEDRSRTPIEHPLEFQPLARLLERKQQQYPPHPRVKPTPAIKTAITEISGKLFDLPNCKANISQAMHIFTAWGRSEEAFIGKLYEVQSITRQQAGVKKPMPYFFKVLRQELDVSG